MGMQYCVVGDDDYEDEDDGAVCVVVFGAHDDVASRWTSSSRWHFFDRGKKTV